MVQVAKVVSIVSCAFVLGFGLTSVATAVEMGVAETEAEQNSARKGSLPGLVKPDEDTLKGIFAMKGEVVSMGPDYYVIKRFNGKEVSLHVDETTKAPRTFSPGEWVEAEVTHYNDGHHALSIDPLKKANPF
ncbi:MAG: hypothetical protein ACREJN_07605 [Nitrospiraceae bacterium]